jgi:hypothetical protein
MTNKPVIGKEHSINGTQRIPIEKNEASPSFPYSAINGGLIVEIISKITQVKVNHKITGIKK